MTQLKHDNPDNVQPINRTVGGNLNTIEDETNLIDYFAVLWKHKFFIFITTLLPTLIVTITLFILPHNYTLTYVYDVSSWDLNENNYTLLLNRFYSEENMKKLCEKLQKYGLEKYSLKLKNSDQLKEFVLIQASPPFLDTKNITDPEQLNKIRDVKTLLLHAIITGKSMQDMPKLSSVVRDNIENTIPLHKVREQISNTIRAYNDQLGSIESNRFSLELAQKSNNEILDGLKNINTSPKDNKQSDVMLQFNMEGQHQYLPLSFQIQAAESRKVELEEDLKIKEVSYQYYTDLLGLSHTLFAELDSRLSSDYTIEQFKSFMMNLAAIHKNPQLKDYLNSYIRTTENRISASISRILASPELAGFLAISR